MNTPPLALTAEINVTPFLDVLLVLIITFLAAMSARKTMDAQLSKPCEGICESSGSSIVLEVMADGSYALNRQPVAARQLLVTLHTTYDARPEKVLQVAGHRDASYQQVLSAMDAARSAGVRVIGIPPSESFRLGSHFPSPSSATVQLQRIK